MDLKVNVGRHGYEALSKAFPSDCYADVQRRWVSSTILTRCLGFVPKLNRHAHLKRFVEPSFLDFSY